MHACTKTGKEVYSFFQCLPAGYAQMNLLMVCQFAVIMVRRLILVITSANRLWPHRHGGKGRLGERGTFSLFAFGTVLQNTLNALQDISGVGSYEYEYY